jgi:hypothetical protein
MPSGAQITNMARFHAKVVPPSSPSAHDCPGPRGRPASLRQNRRMGSVRFTATLVPRGPAAAVVLDSKQVAAVGEGAKRFPVVATVNGYTWRTTITRMRGEFLLGLSRAVRQEAGVEAGDTVDVNVELDTAPREVEVPAALAKALSEDSEARATFDQLAYTHRKEYARWIDEAKRDETRQRRLAKALEMLRQGKTRS